MGGMKARLKASKGTHDLFPPESEKFAAVENTARRVFGSYGYGEIRTPTFEATELFARSVGDTTDIVHKEMYTFADRKGRSLTLRPGEHGRRRACARGEGAPGSPAPDPALVRGPAVPLRAAAGGPLPRVPTRSASSSSGSPARPATPKCSRCSSGSCGRSASPISSPRSTASRAAPRARSFSRALREHAAARAGELGAEDRRRLEENPLRLFDSKDPKAVEILKSAPADARLPGRGLAGAPRAAPGAPAIRRRRFRRGAPRSCAGSTTTR